MAICSAQLLVSQRGPCEAPCRATCSIHSSHRSVNHRSGGQRLATRLTFRQQSSSAAPICQATGFSKPAGDAGSADAAKLPNSREEAVQQAAAAIAAQLGGSGGAKGKGFAGGSSCRKLTVDVPVVESGAAAMMQLAQEIIAALPKQLRQQFTIVSCDDNLDAGSSSSSGGGGAPVVSLRQCVENGADLGGCLLIAGPTSAELDATMRLLAYWRGPGAVALNADWSAESAPVEQVAFVKSFEAVYCFLPLMVKVLFIGQEGAVFKWCTGGNPAATSWRIFGKEGNRLLPIGRMQHRPNNADLEAVFYNAYAANNPLNRGIKFIRSMGDSKKR